MARAKKQVQPVPHTTGNPVELNAMQLTHSTHPTYHMQSMQPVLFVDTSYYIFYRYYATLNWLKRAGKLPEDSDEGESNTVIETLMDRGEFLSMYNKKFEENLIKLSKQYGVRMDCIFLAKDCYRDQIWRMEHFPHYKKNRDERLKTFNGQIFKHTYQNLIPKLQAIHALPVLEQDHAEADDVVAVCHRTLRHQYPSLPIVIVTNDNDLLQLYDAHTKIVNLPGKEIMQRIDYPMESFLDMKILMGDKSDNIPPVFKKCGIKQALKWASDRDALEQKLLTDADAAERYQLNKRIIDFNSIPNDIVEEIQRKAGHVVCKNLIEN